MTDIHQWRRMIQPKHARTSTPAQDHDERSLRSETLSNPDVHHTPHRRSRPRFSTYLSNYLSVAGTRPEPFSVDHFPQFKVSQDIDRHNPERAVDSLYDRLLTEPFKPLPLPLNGAVLRVVEAYRGLETERLQLRTRLAEELGHLHETTEAFREAERKWSEAERDYKAEIKRLELLVAKGKHGVAEVMKARQSSVVKRSRRESVVSPGRREGKETVYEFLERTRRDEETMRKSQRVLLRPLSPSQKMSKLSHKLSTISFHEDLPFGSPPSTEITHSLANVSYLPSRGDSGGRNVSSVRSRPTTDSHIRLSEDGHSAFSSSGDPLPDELDDSSITLIASKKDEDLQVVRQMAAMLARRRGTSIDEVLPQLAGMVFDPQSDEFAASMSSNSSLAPAEIRSLSADATSSKPLALPLIDRSNSITAISKRPSNPTSAKRSQSRPILSTTDTDHLPTIRRPFSFCAGDDSTLHTLRRTTTASPLPSLSLRRGADSLSVLSSVTTRSPPTVSSPGMTSPGAVPSPTPSQTLCPSKIPSPVHDVPAARPRRSRQNSSSSSLLTTLRYSQGELARTVSLSRRGSEASSRKSSGTTALRDDEGSSGAPSSRCSWSGGVGAGGQRLVEQKIGLRGSAKAVVGKGAGDGRAQGRKKHERVASLGSSKGGSERGGGGVRRPSSGGVRR